MTDRLYQVGPLTVEGAGWPPDWETFAEETLHLCDETRIPLRIEFIPQADTGTSGIEVSGHATASVGLHGGRLYLEVSDQVVGHYEEAEATLKLSAAPDASPRMTLGNGLRLFVSSWLPYRLDGLMFHAAGGILGGDGVLFPGISTAGKSTMAKGFRRTTYLSDDISLVDCLSLSPRLVGAPFFGINGWRGASDRASLAAIGILSEKSTSGTSVDRLEPRQAVPALLRHVVSFSRDPRLLEATLARTTELATSVPVFSVKRDLADSADAVVERLLEAADA